MKNYKCLTLCIGNLNHLFSGPSNSAGPGSCQFPFDALIGASIGIKIDSGAEGDVWGIIPGSGSKVYYHNVKLVVGADMVEIKAGFSWDITSNLLGQTGYAHK